MVSILSHNFLLPDRMLQKCFPSCRSGIKSSFKKTFSLGKKKKNPKTEILKLLLTQNGCLIDNRHVGKCYQLAVYWTLKQYPGLVFMAEYHRFSQQCCRLLWAGKCVLWYFLSSISLGDWLSGIPGRWWCSVRLSLPLICSHAADSQGACHRRRAERGLKRSARYSKRRLINNVSERTRWDTAGLHCLSQARTHLWRDWSNLSPSPCLQESPPPPNTPIQCSSQYSNLEANERGGGSRHQALDKCV